MASISLAQMYKMHQQKQERQAEETGKFFVCSFQTSKRELERMRGVVVDSVGVVTSQMMDSINAGVATIFQNQRQLEAEAKKLDAEAAKLNRQAIKWVKLLEEFQKSLKELGDVENWAQTIEADMREIAQAMEYSHQQQSQ